jgi:energy-coupling factor transport system permease protein
MSLAVFALGFAFLVALTQKTYKPVITAFKWSFPFVIPLIIVHGMINPTFPAAFHVGDLLPIRTEGILYALSVSCKIFILTAAVVSWKGIEPERLMSDAIKLHVPDNLVIIVAISTAIIHTITARIKAVYLAQQARGIAAGPGFFARLRALPAVILPVITSTLLEAHARGTLMANRGLGTTRIALLDTEDTMTIKDIVLAGSIIPIFIIAYLLR